MSTGVVVAIVLGGVVLLAAGVTVLIVAILRGRRKHAAMSAPAARAALTGRGWTFAERDDAWIPVYDRQHDRRGWAEPLRRPPRATAARNVVTGVHRGRQFVAATFDTVHAGKHQPERAIWVAAPAAHPMLSAKRIVGPQNAVNRSIGRGGVQLGDEAFDRGFEIHCDDEAFAQAVFGPELKALLLQDPRNIQGLVLRGEYLDVFDPVGDHRNPDELTAALDVRCDILDRIPVWSRA
ncbi:hypothetical protein BJF85_15430 [Saccharomonospora sp. CUA-673]|uniref:hypothetical protein n=1 Tax=Saccharomonospora sp. CUA-673 TaxID=1904969 RepID=UPI000969C257|nr:hypothetical protein [Saccharomonospora sp. CUA-673]OLT47566.1 hypothetical protein BJF85_15430 [Saccharomonospora sp. CUA-673]